MGNWTVSTYTTQASGHSGAAHFEAGVGTASFKKGAASSSHAPQSLPPQEVCQHWASGFGSIVQGQKPEMSLYRFT